MEQLHVLAMEQIVDPASGEILAFAGEEDPPRLLEYVGHYLDSEKALPDWLAEAVDGCMVKQEPWNLTTAQRNAVKEAARDRATSDSVPNGPACVHGRGDAWDCEICSAAVYGGMVDGRCRHGYLPSECPVCDRDDTE